MRASACDGGQAVGGVESDRDLGGLLTLSVRCIGSEVASQDGWSMRMRCVRSSWTCLRRGRSGFCREPEQGACCSGGRSPVTPHLSEPAEPTSPTAPYRPSSGIAFISSGSFSSDGGCVTFARVSPSRRAMSARRMPSPASRMDRWTGSEYNYNVVVGCWRPSAIRMG